MGLVVELVEVVDVLGKSCTVLRYRLSVGEWRPDRTVIVRSDS